MTGYAYENCMSAKRSASAMRASFACASYVDTASDAVSAFVYATGVVSLLVVGAIYALLNVNVLNILVGLIIGCMK